jgi:hypothetical protein
MISLRVRLAGAVLIALALCALSPSVLHARTLVYEGTIRNQTVQESAKARLKLSIEDRKVTGYLTTYPPLQGSGPVSGVYSQGKCELSVVIDEDAVMDLRGSCRDDGFDGGYIVTFESPRYRPQRGSFLLRPVVAGQATDVSNAASDSPHRGVGGFENAPPLGDYGVYRHTGTLGYDFLYRLRFLNENEYMAYDTTRGSYSYDPKTLIFAFTSGPLSAYRGRYSTQETGGVGKPKIVLFLKTAPDPTDGSALLREYLYAFFRPEGIQ